METSPSAPASELLRVDDLRVEYRTTRRRRAVTVTAVGGVSLRLGAGEVLAIIGESGSGKTSLARAILGLERAKAGDVRFHGVDMIAGSKPQIRALRSKMQMIYQDATAALDPRMTIGRSILEPLRVHHRLRRRRAEAVLGEHLARVGLTPAQADRYPHELSGGQRQRVNIARALVLDPEIVVADEPVSALDVSIQAEILNLLARLQAELHLSYIFVSHDLAVVSHLADRIGVMYFGQLVEIGDAEQVLASPQHPYTQALVAAVPRVRRAGEPKEVLSGEMPDPTSPPPGCPFSTRCPLVMERCRGETPALLPVSEARAVACHLVASAAAPVSVEVRS